MKYSFGSRNVSSATANISKNGDRDYERHMNNRDNFQNTSLRAHVRAADNENRDLHSHGLIARIKISRIINLFGTVVVLGLAVAIGTSMIATRQLKVGGPVYERVALEKNLVADILPPPEYIIEPFLEATLLLNNPSNIDVHQERLARLHREYDQRRLYWAVADIDPAIKEKLTQMSHGYAERFWDVLENNFLPAIVKRDEIAARKAYASMEESYFNHRATINELAADANRFGMKIEAEAASADSFYTAIVWSISIFTLGLLIAGVAGLQFGVVGVLTRLTGAMSRLASGDTGVGVPGKARSDELGEMASAIQIFKDNMIESARRRAERLIEKAKEETKQIRAITDNVPVIITYLDANRRFRFINKAGEEWYGRPASGIVGQSLADVLGRNPRIPDSVLFAQLSRGPVKKECVRNRHDGKPRTIESLCVPDYAPGGILRGYYSFVTDITEKKATEEQLRHSQGLHAVGKLTGGVAHDFNNLLAVISGNLELLEEDLREDQQLLRKLTQAAIRAANRGVTLTRSLLAFSRQQPLSPVLVDFAKLVSETANMVRRTVPANVDIVSSIDSSLWNLEVDPGQIQNALINLVVNACDAMPQGGRLTIETVNVSLDDDYSAAHADVRPGQYVMVAVSDTGMGMPPDIKARAFEPFFTTKEFGKGTGLGLSMVYGFAKQSGGHANIYSEVGHGTTVRLYLPRAARSVGATILPVTHLLARARGETILVVEDDSDLLTLTFSLLRSLDYDVLTAESAEEALRVLEHHPEVGLLLTDVILPGELNGRQLAETVVRRKPHVKVLYMSGYTENAILHHGRLDSGVHLLEKPFTKRELAEKIRTVLVN